MPYLFNALHVFFLFFSLSVAYAPFIKVNTLVNYLVMWDKITALFAKFQIFCRIFNVFALIF